MQEIRLTAAGGIAVALDVPDDVPAPGLMLMVRPQTVEQFEKALAALGGADAFSFPRSDSFWDSPASLKDHSAVPVLLYPPPEKIAGVSGMPRQAHPFFKRYTSA